MAPPGGSSKFEPVNLNKSYGHPASSSAALTRSRSYGSGHGGLVLLGRSSRVSSSSSGPSPSPRVPKLSVPKPVNLPSLRREHAGNDPTVALVSSSGSSGWSRQVADDNQESETRRSGSATAEPMWGISHHSQRNNIVPEVVSQNTGRPYSYTSPGSRSSIPEVSVEKASVVFRGEDFPTLQATVVLTPPSSIPQYQQSDLQQKQLDRSYIAQGKQIQTSQQQTAATEPRRSDSLREPHFQSIPSQVERTSLENADIHSYEESRTSRGPSPLIKLSHTSNWADDERETLASFSPEEKARTAQFEHYPSIDHWSVDHSVDGSSRRPASWSGGKERSRFIDSGRVEPDVGNGFDRLGGKLGRNDVYKRGWTFSSVDSISNRDPRPRNLDKKGWDRDPNTKVHLGNGNMHIRNDNVRSEFSSRDIRQGSLQRSGKEDYRKQGIGVGYLSQGDSSLFHIAPNATMRKSGPGIEGWHEQVISGRVRDRRSNMFYGQVQNEDPFLGEIMVAGSGLFSGQLGRNIKVSKMKKSMTRDENIKDPARESFEAELERVQKMLELQRQRAAEEQEKAIELARKEQEERERLAREEQELRFKLEEEARQATIQAQRQAEELARRTEELRRAREEEKRKAELEEERRKEAARKKLSELEERIAKRQEQNSQKRDQTTEAAAKQVVGNNHQRNGELNREFHRKVSPVSNRDQHNEPTIGRRESLCLLGPVSLSPQGLAQKSGYSPRWRRETLEENGQEVLSMQRISARNYSYSKADSSKIDHSEHRGFRNLSKKLKSATDIEDRHLSSEGTNADAGNWWRRDEPSQSEPAVANYLQGTDTSEYPSFSRLRQSLPKQPRVLPPPPGSTTLLRKHHFQSDESKSITSVSGMTFSDLAIESIEDLSPKTVNDVPESENLNVLGSKQTESVSFEEVVLSDAVSQFSDDTVEDEPVVDIQADQNQGSHSDVVSEVYSEDMNVVSDAQENSQVVESSTLQVSTEGKLNDVGAGGVFKEENCDLNDNKVKFKEAEIITKGNMARSDHNTTVLEGDGREQFLVTDMVAEKTSNETWDSTGIKNVGFIESGNLQLKDTIVSDMQTEPVAEKVAGDHIQHSSHHIPFLSASTVDASQMSFSEGLVSRQSLVQQFQQPFSFMAVPLSQSSSLNNVSINQAILSSSQSLQNQQEFPLLQLGLFPNVPLMPNAIQIGSIQMPLHIHSQIPQFGQQTPILQFGQIGQTGSISQPSSVLQPALQVLPVTSPSIVQSLAELKVVEQLNASSNTEELQKVKISEEPSRGEIDRYTDQNETAPCKTYQFHEGDNSLCDQVVDHSLKINSTSQGDVHAVKSDVDNSQMAVKMVSERNSRGRRRNNVSRYSGILGKGIMRTRQRNGFQAMGDIESRFENGSKRMGQGRIHHRSFHRTEYKIRTPVSNTDGESVAVPVVRGKYESRKEEKNKILNKEAENQFYGHTGPNSLNSNAEVRRYQPAGKLEQLSFQNGRTSNRGYFKKIEVGTTEDASRVGVVCVYEQPGIEIQNDKDDFIKVRSKRQLHREQREQRKRENWMEPMEPKTHHRYNLKAGMHSMAGDAKKSGQRTTSQASVVSTSTQAIPLTVGGKTKNKPSDSFQKSSSFLKAGQASSILSGINMDSRDSGQCLHGDCGNGQLTAAWGGQQSNQEVVSFTQIQLEEAMKPFRLEGPLPDQALDTATSRTTVSLSEKTAVLINAPSPISSLLAGEKIQFGAVTSPPPIPSNSSPSSPLSHVETNLTFESRAETTYLSRRPSHFNEAAFDGKEKHGGGHSFQRKAMDLEAEGEAAASAVAAAAISNEDMIESNSDSSAPLMGRGNSGEGFSMSRPVIIQAKNHCSMGNPTSVSLPADLLVEIPSTLFQASSLNRSASSGVMLPSLQGGTAPFPCLEMGPMLGGPIFAYGPREEASFTPFEPGLAGWHQSHLSTPDSFYNAPPFMNPTGLSNVRGHPPMLVYANQFAPVGQFGQVGVGFMGTTYQPSKQPDWTHVPMPSSSGAFGLTDCEMDIVSSTNNEASDPSPPQQTSVPGPSMMALSTPNFFEASGAPFQSHWSKAPAPPASSIAISGTSQTSVARSTPILPHYSRIIPGHSGYIAHLMDVSNGLNDLPVLKPFSSDVNPRFPDELGLGDTITSENGYLKDSTDGLSDVGKSSSFGAAGKRLQTSATSQTTEDLKSTGNANSEDDLVFHKYQVESGIQMGPSGHHTSSSEPFLNVKASEQKMIDNAKSQWSGGINHRKGTSGRFPSDRGPGQPSKVKQIYVAKSVSASPKVNALTDSACRL